MRFKLIIRPDGAAILATEMELQPAQLAFLQEAWKEWSATHGVLIFEQTEVITIRQLELEVDP